MRLSVYRYILLLGYALRTNPTYAQNHCVIAIHRKPHTVLRRLAVQPRTVFGDAPCLKLSVDGYMTNYYRSGGYGLRPNRPYGLCPAGGEIQTVNSS